MTNVEILQKAHQEAGEYLELSVTDLQLAIQSLEIANMDIKDIHTAGRIMNLKMRYADLEFFALATKTIQIISNEDKKTSQCYNCEGSGKVQADNCEIPCPMCDGSGTLTT